MYPAEIVAPMRAELVEEGFKELLTAAEVESALDNKEGTTFLVINSVCGCAAGNARPAVRKAITNEKSPDHLVTVFAGVDREAVDKAREFTVPYPPSSPSMAMFKEGKLVHFIERHQIEGNTAHAICAHLKQVFDHFC